MARTPGSTYNRARKLRKTMTPPEIMLWQRLRTRPLNLKFRRQHPVGPYVLDFYCAAARTAIEIDGAVHDMGDNAERDQRRDDYLAKKGITVLRIAAQEVIDNADDAADQLVRAIADRA
ncbi:endonuclease domain-containing protein [Alterisphingorhabdus coralli]|uniref:Endonuclease domain-containing protein n=1 Tax=Alterisphingorhabdus coralli TaxID=3071408 RepID=A0AA97F6H8_9SPHN|nr:endonuclease domain-containing protein [Parasphingorhabdus sp. SCSIO 66989]WOE75101.1 endonuclease domain-containing protein [Parasphingorhabdus sp. SCSIO 66989]